MGGHYLMLHTGTSIAYAESMDTVPLNMAEVRPTLVLSVPRLYEKMYARVLENALSGGALKKQIFFWARGVAERWADVKLAGGTPGGLLALQYGIAQKLVFSKLQGAHRRPAALFRVGRRAARAGDQQVLLRGGTVILEGYGLTETSPVIAVNTPDELPDRHRRASRCRASEIKIADDGEILTRGPHVMKGYLQQARRDGRGDRRGRLVPYGRHRRARGRLPRDHRSQEGHHRHRGRQEHRATADRERGQDEQVRQPGGDDRRQAQIPGHARRAELGQAREVGEAQQHHLDRPRASCWRMPTIQAKMEKEVRAAARPRALRDAEEDRAARARLLDRAGRADAHR